MNRFENLTYKEDLTNIISSELPFSALKGKRILITGATGLIGTCLIDALMTLNEKEKLKIEVTAICRNVIKAKAIFEKYLDENFLQIVESDITEPFVSESVWDYIIHGAGNNHPYAFAIEPVETMKAAILGTFSLLEHGKNQENRTILRKDHANKDNSINKLERFLLLSTGEVYGEQMNFSEEGCSETDFGLVNTLESRSCYPEGKRAAETICSSYAKEFGMDTVIARLGYVYGATMQANSSKADIQFFQKAINGNDIVMKSEGLQYRSYIYLADAVTGIFYCLLKGKKGEAYNVANADSNATIKTFAETLANAAGVKLVFESPDFLEKSGYSTMKKEILKADKIYELGFKGKIKLQEGIGRTVKILRN